MTEDLVPLDAEEQTALIVRIGYRELLLPNTPKHREAAALLAQDGKPVDTVYTEAEGSVYLVDSNDISMHIKGIKFVAGMTQQEYYDLKAKAKAEREDADIEPAPPPALEAAE